MKSNQIPPLIIVSLLILAYFKIIITNSVDIPIGDDLFCLMSFTQNFQDTPNWLERLSLLTDQWVEHRILFSRLSALISYWMTGKVNFINIILIGNLSLVGLTVLFGKFLEKIGRSMYYLIPITLILFSPVMYEGNVWAGASTVYMPVCFLSLLTSYLLVYKPRFGFFFASLFAIFTTFSFGNGMFSYVSGFVIFLYQKQFKKLAAWAGMAMVAILLYFRNFVAISATNAFSFSNHFYKPSYLFYNLFGFIGGIFDFVENISTPLLTENLPAVYLGGVLSILAFYGTYQIIIEIKASDSTIENRPRVLWIVMTLFAGITSIATAYSRTAGESMNTLSSRYKIYSIVIYIMVYLFCLMSFNKKALTGLFFGIVSLILLILSYYADYQKMANYKSIFLSGLYNYNHNGHWIIYCQTSYYEAASKVLCDAVKTKTKPVYSFEEVFQELNQQTLKDAQVHKKIKVIATCDSKSTSVKYLSISSDSYPSLSNVHQGVYIVVYNDKNIMLLAAKPSRNGRIDMLTTGRYFKRGFTFEQDFSSQLEKGTEYKMAVFCPTEVEKIKLVNYRLRG